MIFNRDKYKKQIARIIAPHKRGKGAWVNIMRAGQAIANLETMLVEDEDKPVVAKSGREEYIIHRKEIVGWYLELCANAWEIMEGKR